MDRGGHRPVKAQENRSDNSEKLRDLRASKSQRLKGIKESYDSVRALRRELKKLLIIFREANGDGVTDRAVCDPLGINADVECEGAEGGASFSSECPVSMSVERLDMLMDAQRVQNGKLQEQLNGLLGQPATAPPGVGVQPGHSPQIDASAKPVASIPVGMFAKAITPQKRMYGNTPLGIEGNPVSFSTPSGGLSQVGSGASNGNLLSTLSGNRALSTRVTPQRGPPFNVLKNQYTIGRE